MPSTAGIAGYLKKNPEWSGQLKNMLYRAWVARNGGLLQGANTVHGAL
jgi:hypothetical protein